MEPNGQETTEIWCGGLAGDFTILRVFYNGLKPYIPRHIPRSPRPGKFFESKDVGDEIGRLNVRPDTAAIASARP
jgi:hypothetical protein